MAGETILIVEPNPIVLQFMVKEISPQSLKPLLAQTPEEAVNLALTRLPHLLLLHLPLESASTLLHKLAQANYLLPTVLILESEINQVSVDFLRLGVQDYLTLPFTGEQLRQVIEDHLATPNKAEDQQTEGFALISPEQSFKSIEQLVKVGRSVHSLLDQEAVVRQITEAAVHLAGAEEGYLLLLDPETAELRVRAEQHLGESQAQCVNLRVKDSLADSVVQSGKPILLNGNETQPIKIRTGYLVKSLISVPLKINERIIGVLGVSNRKSNAGFTSEHLFRLSFLAESASVALENARLYTEMRGKFYRRVREFTTLRALVAQLGIITDFEVGAQLVLSFVLKATNAEAGVLAWVEPESPGKLLYTSQGVIGEGVLHQGRESTQRNWWNESVLHEVLESGKARLCHHLSPKEVSIYSTQTQSRLTVPVHQGRQTVGVINLESSFPHAFTEDDLYFIESVADQVTIALKNTILQGEIVASQRQFSLLMDAVNNGVWLLDTDLNLLAQKQGGQQDYGWVVDQSNGANFT